MVDPQGGLWIILQSTQVLRYSNGDFELGHDEAEFGITSIASLKDGRVAPLVAGPGTHCNIVPPISGSHFSQSSVPLLNGKQNHADNMSRPPQFGYRRGSHRLPSQTRPSINRATTDGKYGWARGIEGSSNIGQGEGFAQR